MKKLLLVPFLIVSQFSFSGELKAHPDSRYELPDPRIFLSESQSNSNDVWYLLTQTEIQWKGNKYVPFKGWSTVAFEKLKISKYGNGSICQRLASEKKRWINQIDLGKFEEIDFRYKPYTKCLKGVDENGSNYALEISSIKMKKARDRNNNIAEIIIHDFDGYSENADDLSSFDTLYFKDLSKCNLAKSQLDSWFSSLENRFLNNSKFRSKEDLDGKRIWMLINLEMWLQGNS